MDNKPSIFTTEVFVIAAVEVGFGIFEGIVLPNFIGQTIDKNWKFKFPSGQTVIRIMVVLVITGFISGIISDQIIRRYDQQMPAIV